MRLIQNSHCASYGEDIHEGKLEEEIFQIERLLDDYDNLNASEKLDLLSHLFDLRLEVKDFIDLINGKYNKEFACIVPIKTKMESSRLKAKDDNWAPEKVRVNYECAATIDFFPKDKLYSYEDIVRLIEKGKIYPVFRELESIPEFSEDREEYHRIRVFTPDEIEVKRSEFLTGLYALVNGKKYTDDIIALLESQYPREKVLGDIKTYIEGIIAHYQRIDKHYTEEELGTVNKLKTLYAVKFPKQEKNRY